MATSMRRLIVVGVTTALVAAGGLISSAAVAVGADPGPAPPVCVTPPIPSTCPGPIVTGAFPSGGPAAGGTTVTILGSHFSRCGGVQAVLFDGIAGDSVSVQSDMKLTVVAPPHNPGFASVTVQAHCGTSFPFLFTYT
jgi:hypothetical protein